MFSTWINDIKAHMFVAGVALMLMVGLFTKLQLFMGFLAFHYAIELVRLDISEKKRESGKS